MTTGKQGNDGAGVLSKVGSRVDGGWVVTSALLTAEITDDGRVLVGADRARRPAEGRGHRQGAMTTVAAAAAVSPSVTDGQPLAISTEGLTRRFGTHVAVNGVSLTVPQGAVYGFLGPNGSGKTTTIRLLLGLMNAHSGAISLLGGAMPVDAARVLPRVGTLVEGPAFHPYLSRSRQPGQARRVRRHRPTPVPRRRGSPPRSSGWGCRRRRARTSAATPSA